MLINFIFSNTSDSLMSEKLLKERLPKIRICEIGQ